MIVPFSWQHASAFIIVVLPAPLGAHDLSRGTRLEATGHLVQDAVPTGWAVPPVARVHDEARAGFLEMFGELRTGPSRI